jgi:predicted dehydrogenase
MTAFPMRFAPSTRAVRTMLKNGELGRVLGISGINHSEIPKGHRTWFADKQLAGGGAVMDHTVHLVDLFRWFFDAEVVEGYAEVDNLFFRNELDVDTAGLILVTLSNGVQASIDCSWSRPTCYPRWGHLKMEFVGEQGTVVLDAFAQHLTLYSRGAARARVGSVLVLIPIKRCSKSLSTAFAKIRIQPLPGTMATRRCAWHWQLMNQP